MKMITGKSILALIGAMLCLAGVYFVSPLTEQYQGVTGYMYENGMWYQLLFVILLIGTIMLFCYSIVEMYEVRN